MKENLCKMKSPSSSQPYTFLRQTRVPLWPLCARQGAGNTVSPRREGLGGKGESQRDLYHVNQLSQVSYSGFRAISAFFPGFLLHLSFSFIQYQKKIR